MWEELKEKLSSLENYPCELFFTLCEGHSDNQNLIDDIRLNYPQSKIEVLANYGYDVGPFIHVINQVNLDDYSYIIKLHTKRDLHDVNAKINKFSVSGELWRNYLFSVISSPSTLKKHIERLEKSRECGMLSDFRIIIKNDKYDKKAKRKVQELLNAHDIRISEFSFVAGTMFIAKASPFKLLQRFSLTLEDFEEGGNARMGELAHAVERLLGAIIYADGYTLCDCMHSKYAIWYHRITNSLGRLLSYSSLKR